MDYLVPGEEAMKDGYGRVSKHQYWDLYNRIINYLKIITFTADNLYIIISIVKRKGGSGELDDSR